MFCSANDVLLSLTEKTKNFAQKCTRQTNNRNNTIKQQNRHHVNDTDTNTLRMVAVEHIKSISKSNVDVHRCAGGDGDKHYDEMFKTISPRKINANALRGKNLVNCFNTLTGSLRLKRRKSLSDKDPSISDSNRRKLSAANIGYATTRWYVKVSIHRDFFFLFSVCLCVWFSSFLALSNQIKSN